MGRAGWGVVVALVCGFSFAGCIGDEAPLTLEDEAWEPFTRLKGIGHIGFSFTVCLPPDSNVPDFPACLDLDAAVDEVVCDPPQLRTIAYELALATGIWPSVHELATAERLQDHQARWSPDPQAPYLTCAANLAWTATGSSMLPGTFTMHVSFVEEEAHTCSIDPNGSCTLTGAVTIPLEFTGPDQELEPVVSFEGQMEAAGMVRTFSAVGQDFNLIAAT